VAHKTEGHYEIHGSGLEMAVIVETKKIQVNLVPNPSGMNTSSPKLAISIFLP